MLQVSVHGIGYSKNLYFSSYTLTMQCLLVSHVLYSGSFLLFSILFILVELSWFYFTSLNTTIMWMLSLLPLCSISLTFFEIVYYFLIFVLLIVLYLSLLLLNKTLISISFPLFFISEIILSFSSISFLSLVNFVFIYS